MSGIINQVGARSGIISGGGSASAGTVTLSGTTGLDYEEGEWTPANASFGLTINTATYTKIGNRCFINCRIISTGAGDGSVGFTGLPFTIDGDHIGTVITHLVDWDTGTSLALYLEDNQTKAVILVAGDDIAWTDTTTFAISETIIFTCSYKIK